MGREFDFDCMANIVDWSEFVAEQGKEVACASYDIADFDVSWCRRSVL